MGLAASQARFLTLTARQNDIEYQTQQICDSKLRLSTQLEQIANEYNTALSDRTLNVSSSSYAVLQNQAISTSNLSSQGLQVYVVNKGVLFDDYTPAEGEVKESLEDGLRDGTYILIEQANPFSQQSFSVNGLSGNYQTVDWHTDSSISDDLFTANDGKAETIYNNKVSALQLQDKKLTIQEEKLDTEHKAVESELEAVKKIIDDESKNSFKTFYA